MIALIIASIVGILIRFGVAWGTDASFTIEQNKRQFITSVIVMIPVIALFYFLKANHWSVWFLVAAIGFLTKYIVEKASKIKG